MSEPRLIYWTADVADTGCDIERNHPAESCRSGWIDPAWSLDEVGPERETDAVPDVMPDGEEPAAWLAETVARRIGVPDDSGRGYGTWYAADTVQVPGNGCLGTAGALLEVRVAAHAFGFTAEERAEAERLLRARLSA